MFITFYTFYNISPPFGIFGYFWRMWHPKHLKSVRVTLFILHRAKERLEGVPIRQYAIPLMKMSLNGNRKSMSP